MLGTLCAISLSTLGFLAIVFGAKVLDNMLGTAKIILVQRNQCILAGVALAASNFITYLVTKIIVNEDGYLIMIIASLASGVGCFLAMMIDKRLSKDRMYVNIVMSDNKEAMQEFRDFLASHHITNVATDCYTKDWNKKTITVTAYTETKAKNKLIDEYLAQTPVKMKRLIQEQ